MKTVRLGKTGLKVSRIGIGGISIPRLAEDEAVRVVSFSFMIDSLFNLSGKNLFAAMLAHQSADTVNIFVYKGHENVLTLILLASFVILLRFQERMRGARRLKK